MRKITAIAVFLLNFSLFGCAYAGIFINEIMYDAEGADDGREWLEVYNDSDASVDLTVYKFYENDTNHKIIPYQGGSNILAKGYAVISQNPEKFLKDWPNFSGTIFKSSFLLSNSGETLTIKDADLKTIDQYTYSSNKGGSGGGQSLQKISGAWAYAKPTPNSENKPGVAEKKVIETENVAEIGHETKPVAKIPETKKIVKKKTVSGDSVPVKVEPSQDFTALALKSVEASTVQSFSEQKNTDFYLFLTLVLLLSAIGALLIYLLRKNKANSPQTGDDFEILEE